MKKFNIGTIKTNLHTNGYVKGLVLNRDLTVKECRHIMRSILGICISTREDFDFSYDLKDYNDELTECVNKWLRGEMEDHMVMEFAYDCSDYDIGIMNLIPIIAYLKKKNIID